MLKIPVALVLTAATTLTACAGTADATLQADAPTPAEALPQSAVAVEAVAPDAPLPITTADAEGLLFMREEEKLAHDVYLAMFDLWGIGAFENIAASEQRHTDAVLGLIETYGLIDPVADDTPGVFTNPDLAALYEDLVEAGSVSAEAALEVGALIEDLDISDLRSWVELTGDPAIERVYANLLSGSENHLRAFVGLLDDRGIDYEPTYLSDDDVSGILAPSSGGGGRHTGHRGGRR